MKRDFQFALVDAFTSQPLGGNPCSVIFGAETLTETEMLRIAKEMNQSETAFIMRSESADLRARYFTPEREIPLAGHPTLASIQAALELNFIKHPSLPGEISLELNDGPIKVLLEKTNQKLLIRMFQRKPVFSEIHNSELALSMFGL